MEVFSLDIWPPPPPPPPTLGGLPSLAVVFESTSKTTMSLARGRYDFSFVCKTPGKFLTILRKIFEYNILKPGTRKEKINFTYVKKYFFFFFSYV